MYELLGIIAVTIMVASYALEHKHPLFILIFAFGCTLATFYAYLINSYPFLIAEGLWALIAIWRYVKIRNKNSHQGK